MDELLKKCQLCPNNCKVDRISGMLGKCKAAAEVTVALSALHMFEEPCISGKNGSGAVFFSNCNLGCIYCQNYKISQLGIGNKVSINELSDMFLKHQQNNAHNINLVSPTPYVPQIIEAIKIARANGLKLPIIYNCGGYETVETLKMLEGYIDVYLPDFKYEDNKLAKKYSKIDNYFENVVLALQEMYRQVGIPKLDKNGIIYKGMIIRHLVLPGYVENSKNILKWIADNMDNQIYISLMAQYFPTYKAKEDNIINRKLTEDEYKEIENYLFDLNLDNGYIQDLEENEEIYVPDFK